MKKLLITRPLPDTVVEAAAQDFDVTLRADTSPMRPDELRMSLTDYDAVLPTLRDLYSADVFADVASPRARILANFGVGYNHIDVAAARAAGVTVTNTPGAVTDATADIAMTLILMSCRRAGEGERLVRAGKWDGWHPTQLLGQHVSGKRIGIVGMGRIGQAIAHRCHFGFGMEIAFVQRSAKEFAFPATPYGSLLEMAADVDLLVVAVPGGADTEHMINAEVFHALPDHAHMINISRGEVVDETALIAALSKGEIAGAGLDVYEFEPHVPEALLALDNVTLLPHLGTAALEVRVGMGLMAVENLRAFHHGLDLPNQV